MTIADRHFENLEIISVDEHNREIAVSLLQRFFQEEGFSGGRSFIAANLDQMRRDDNHWVAVAVYNGHIAGIVTVTSMLYIEWGRLGEIGDLYVLPEARGNGIARRLVQAAIDWCRARGCSAVEVIMTPLGEATHGLSNFYSRLGFAATGRTISLLPLRKLGEGSRAEPRMKANGLGRLFRRFSARYSRDRENHRCRWRVG